MKTLFRLIPALCLGAALAAVPARAQGPGAAPGAKQPWLRFEKELGLQTVYSVDMVMQTRGLSLNSRTVRNGAKVRTEMTMPFNNLKMIGLEIPENGKTVSYSLLPDRKKYVVNAGAGAAGAAAAPPQIEELGTETFEGVACTKRRVTLVQKGIRSEMTILFSPEQKNMPVKMTMNAAGASVPGQPAQPVQSVILFRNYDFATPADSQFAIPADYTRAASMMEIMMGAMGGPRPPEPPAR